MIPLNLEGQALPDIELDLETGEKMKVSMKDLDPNGEISSIILPDNHAVFFGIVYQNKFVPTSQAYVAESDQTASLWRFYPHKGLETYHGLAVFNAGNFSAHVYLNQYDLSKELITSVNLGSFEPRQKLLHLIPISEQDETQASTYYEVISESPMHLNVLAGIDKNPEAQ